MSGIATPELPLATDLDDVLGNNAGNTVRVSMARLASLVGTMIGPAYKTRATLLGELDWPAGSIGSVWGDANEAFNGTYIKTGGAGSGSWTRIGDLPANSVSEAKLAALSAEMADAVASLSRRRTAVFFSRDDAYDGIRDLPEAAVAAFVIEGGRLVLRRRNVQDARLFTAGDPWGVEWSLDAAAIAEDVDDLQYRRAAFYTSLTDAINAIPRMAPTGHFVFIVEAGTLVVRKRDATTDRLFSSGDPWGVFWSGAAVEDLIAANRRIDDETAARRLATAAGGALPLVRVSKTESGGREIYEAEIAEQAGVTEPSARSAFRLTAPTGNSLSYTMLKIGQTAWRIHRADGEFLQPGDIVRGQTYLLQAIDDTVRVIGVTNMQVAEAVAVETAARQAAITQSARDTKQQVGVEYELAVRKGRRVAMRNRAIALVHTADGVPVLGVGPNGKIKAPLDIPDPVPIINAAVSAAVAALPNPTTAVNEAVSKLPVRAPGKGRQITLRGGMQALIVDADGVPSAGANKKGEFNFRRTSGDGTVMQMTETGEYAAFAGPSYTGATLNGMTVRKNSAGTVYAPASAEMLGVFLYGQSYFGTNEGGGIGSPGAVARLRGPAKMPLEIVCLNDGRGPIGWNTANSSVHATGFVPYTEEIITANPSIAGPLGLRLAEDFHHRGQRMPILVRSAARDGSRLEVLAPSDLSWHVPTNDPFEKLTRAVQNFTTICRSLGLTPYVPAVCWAQGQNNRNTPYGQCVEWLSIIWTRIQQMVMQVTGQRRIPAIVVYQSPSDHQNGNWEIMQAQVDLCRNRPDWVLAQAGWASPQWDYTHHSSEGCITAGSALGYVIGQLLLGRARSAPFLDYATRSGNVITAHIGGQPVKEDWSLRTRRHYLSEAGVPDGQLSTPIPFAGFEFSPSNSTSTAAIIAHEVARDGWSVKLTLNEAAPEGVLEHAWHGESRQTGTTRVNESANRGTLRARDTYPDSWNETGDIRIWMASGYAHVA